MVVLLLLMVLPVKELAVRRPGELQGGHGDRSHTQQHDVGASASSRRTLALFSFLVFARSFPRSLPSSSYSLSFSLFLETPNPARQRDLAAAALPSSRALSLSLSLRLGTRVLACLLVSVCVCVYVCAARMC